MNKIKIPTSAFNTLLNYGRADWNDIDCNGQLKLNAIDCLKDSNLILVENIEFEEMSNQKFLIEIRNNASEIIIKDCIFNNNLCISGTTLNKISISNTCFNNGLKIVGSFLGFTIQECKNPFNFEFNGSTHEKIEIINSKFIELSIKTDHSPSLNFEKLEIKNNTYISARSSDYILVSDFVANILEFNKTDLKRKIIIGENSSIREIKFVNNAVLDLNITQSDVDHVSLANTDFNSVNFIKSKFESILIHTISNIKNIHIEACLVKKLEISGKLTQDSNFTILNTVFINFIISHFKNLGNCKFAFIDIADKGKLEISNSSVGKLEIHKLNFLDSIIEFDKTNISEVFISETDFPHFVYKKNKIDHGQAKLFFGQLSSIFQKQGDSVRAYEYLAREVKAYYHQLNWFSRDILTKFNLGLNYISNNFGRNWFQGFIFSIGIGFLFFYFLLLSTNEIELGFGKINWNFTSSFLKFMNPLRHFETESLFKNAETGKIGLKLSNWSYLWDFLGRIFVAYGYYQTIQAFRKFGRK